jgi:dihydropyrimidinase
MLVASCEWPKEEVMFDLVLADGTLVDPALGEYRADIAVRDGRIAAILAPGTPHEARETVSAERLHVFPGGIDPHTHIGYAGTFSEDVETESRSAAVGGITTVISFHRHYKSATPKPYDDLDELIAAVEERAYIDMSLHLGILTEEQAGEIEKYIAQGISSFKFYMAYRGEDGKTVGMINEINDGIMFDSFEVIGRHPHAVACVHCENTDIIGRYLSRAKVAGLDGLVAWNAARPAFAEAEHVRRAGYFAEHAGCRLYYVHIGAKEGLEEALLQQQRYGGLTVETCIHYLTHTECSDIGNLGKVNPPLRTPEDLERIWQAVIRGEIAVVGTDHCAVSAAQKQGTIWQAASGFPGMATIFTVMLSEGYHKRGMSLQRIAQLTSQNAARQFNMYPHKGSLAVGADADFAVIDIEKEKVVRAADLLSVSDFSLYDGMTMKGWPVRTYSRGRLVAIDGQVVGEPGWGQFLRR